MIRSSWHILSVSEACTDRDEVSRPLLSPTCSGQSRRGTTSLHQPPICTEQLSRAGRPESRKQHSHPATTLFHWWEAEQVIFLSRQPITTHQGENCTEQRREALLLSLFCEGSSLTAASDVIFFICLGFTNSSFMLYYFMATTSPIISYRPSEM